MQINEVQEEGLIEEQTPPETEDGRVSEDAVEADAEESVDPIGSARDRRKRKRSDVLFYGFLAFMGLLMIGLVVGVICICTGVGVGCTCSECVG
ncbi:MAG: hypothetical protein IJT69_03605 [Clostridia bacterium]|nr:hypothetical protein [Clostridia bacterium]